MRTVLVCLCCLFGGAGLWALDTVEEKPDAPPLSEADANKYAELLSYSISLVTEQYVRPVERASLVTAALQGLYESARVPVPATLAENVRKTTADRDLQALIVATRTRLGDRESFRLHNDVLISLRAMAQTLDPHSGLVGGDELNRGVGNDFNQGYGLDVIDNLGVGPLVIKTVVTGGPAQRAGLRPGDQVTHLDGKPVASLTNPALLLRPSLGQLIVQAEDKPTQVELTVLRPGAKAPRKLALEQQSFKSESVLGVSRQDDNGWNYLVDRQNKIAHVRVAALSSGTAEELTLVMGSLQRQEIRGLILDLRWCPGGFLNEAVIVAQLFVGETKVATVKARDGRETVYNTARAHKFGGFPMVVLVNGETSGGAELIAAALQDTQRAVVAGQRTLGKASVQTMVSLPIPNTGMKLTSGTFIRPSGKNLHRFPDSKPADDWGVRPSADLEFRTSADLSRQLRDWWLLQTLRPGPSNEILPLDDPVADPQRQAALQALLGMMKQS